MNDRRDPRIMALVVELAESAPSAPAYDQLEEIAEREAEPDERLGDDLMVDYLQQRPDESDAASERKRWSGVVVAVAATILVVVGVVVVADGNSSEVVTDPVSSPSVDDPVASSSVADSVPSNERSEVPEDQAVFRRGRMVSVAVGGPGLVAVGQGGDRAAVVWTSVDGITWSRVPHDQAVFGVAGMESVAVGGPGLVAVGGDYSGGTSLAAGVGSDAAVWTSVDGLTWSRVPHDVAVFDGAIMYGVAVGGPGLVAVGQGGGRAAVVWTSVDGITWSRVPHDEAVFGGGWLNSVIAAGPGLVAVGSVESDNDPDGRDAAVWTSVDGITWSRVPHDESLFGGAENQDMIDVTVGGPGLVAVGRDGQETWDYTLGQVAAVWTSVDGITWSRVPRVEEAVCDPADESSTGSAMLSVTSGGPGLVAVGTSGCPGSGAAMWTSVDGITWSVVPHDEEFSGRAPWVGVPFMSSVIAAGPGLVAVGNAVGSYSENAAVWTSVDGLAWSRLTHDEATEPVFDN